MFQRHNLRGSIFLKPSVFELPPRKLKDTNRLETKPFNEDVTLRRNYSNTHNLDRITNFMISFSIDNKRDNITSLGFQNNSMKEENQIESTRRKNFHNNASLTSNPYKKYDVNLSYNKLMSLLNKLEEEAKIAQIPWDRKDILDYKIRKIYKIFVEKAFPPKTIENRDEHRYKTQTFDDISRNDSLYKYKEQFITVRKQDLKKINDYNAPPTKLGFNEHFRKINLLDELKDKPQNYISSDELLGIRNIHEYRKMKGEKANGFKKENSLSYRQDDLLPLERRKFYEDKLKNLERRLQRINNHNSENKVSNFYNCVLITLRKSLILYFVIGIVIQQLQKDQFLYSAITSKRVLTDLRVGVLCVIKIFNCFNGVFISSRCM